MKKEMLIVVIFSALSAAFIYAANTFGIEFLARNEIKRIVLIGLLLLVQNQVFDSLLNKFVVTNPDVIQKKRKLYLFYTEIEDSFHKAYEYAMKVNTHEAIYALLAYLDLDLMGENSYESGKKWLLKQEPIPSTVMGEKLSLRQRTSAKNRINRYELKRSYYEDIFFDCLTGKIIEKEQKQPIIETILIWLSYFYFLTEVFNININAYSTLIIIFIGLTIADISKHYVSYNMVVKHHVDMINRFHQNLQEMYECMNEPDCQYIEIDGEMVPTSIKPGIRIKQIDF